MSESNGTPAPHKAFLTSRPFPIQLEEDGPVLTYVVKPMKQKGKTDYQNLMSSQMKFSPQGKQIGMSKFDGLESKLVAQCLYDPDGKPVPQATIEEWPTPLVTALLKECISINGMTPDAEDAAKK